MALEVRQAQGPDDWAMFEALVREYLASLPFAVDFQDVDGELADIDAQYGPPSGVALLAVVDGAVVGVVGVRAFSGGAGGDAEVKRMFVRAEGRGAGAGRALAEAAIAAARRLGHRRLLLDTVDSMAPAIALYRSLGFVEIEPYRHNPLAGARYFALDL